MADVRYRPTTAHDLWLVATNMREQDREELRASGHGDPLSVLQEAEAISDWTATMEVDGEAAAIFGVVESRIAGIEGPVHVPWMLGSTVLHKHKRLLLTESPAIVHTMRQEYSFLMNMVFAGSKKSVAWLRRLGFRIDEAVPFGDKGELFHPFTLRS